MLNVFAFKKENKVEFAKLLLYHSMDPTIMNKYDIAIYENLACFDNQFITNLL